jgi:hypothetical protein
LVEMLKGDEEVRLVKVEGEDGEVKPMVAGHNPPWT